MDFYDQIADRYAELTGASDRRGPARLFAEKLIDRFSIRSAVDAACGAGLFAIELARCGVSVTASDISAEMLRHAQVNAAEAGLAPDSCCWIESPMQDLAALVSEPRDAVVCMGNSIPHLLGDDELKRTFEGFAGMLKPGRVVCVHLLNYARVLARRERIVGINRRGDRQFVRFYDFRDDLVDFNILEMQWGDDGICRHNLLTTPLRPYLRDDLADALTGAGFERIECFGDLQFNPFDPQAGDILLMTAIRGPGR